MNKMLSILKVVTAFTIFFSLAFSAASVLADDECKDPIANWQPREMLKQKLEQQGWRVKRIRIDDGCYDVRAIDEQGRRVKATYAPASFTLLELEVKHDKPSEQQH